MAEDSVSAIPPWLLLSGLTIVIVIFGIAHVATGGMGSDGLELLFAVTVGAAIGLIAGRLLWRRIKPDT